MNVFWKGVCCFVEQIVVNWVFYLAKVTRRYWIEVVCEIWLLMVLILVGSCLWENGSKENGLVFMGLWRFTGLHFFMAMRRMKRLNGMSVGGWKWWLTPLSSYVALTSFIHVFSFTQTSNLLQISNANFLS